MKILGTKFFGHDSAISLIDTEKKEIFAISTERVTRIKHDELDIIEILNEYNIKDIDYITHSFSDANPYEWSFYISLNRFIRDKIKPKYIKDLKGSSSKEFKVKVLKEYLFKQPLKTIEAIKNYILYRYFFLDNRNSVVLKKFLSKELSKNEIKFKNIDFYDHHLCHAVTSYFFSNFNNQKALLFTIDGFGDGHFSKLYLMNENNQYSNIGNSKTVLFNKTENILDIGSIGNIYCNFTIAMDLTPNSDEGKVEARAAFGKKDEKLYEQLMGVVSFEKLNMVLDNNKIRLFYDISLLKEQRKKIGDENFCATVQNWLEDIVVEYLNIVGKEYPNITNLCLSGGVAANIIMSLNIYERTQFKNIYVLPPMGDDGTAIGAAILKALELGEDISWLKEYYMPYFGDEIKEEDILKALNTTFKDKVSYQKIGDGWQEIAAKSVAENKIVAICHGRMEFGPRALGNRSIIANPIHQDTRERINSTVKRRPSYQPFCPSILEEERERLFDKSFPHKHMAIAFRMKKEFWEKLPSAIHIDGTARPQFVEERDNQNYYRLIKEVQKLTGFGVVINTSFNLHGRTIVRTAEDAILDFIDCNIDELYLEGYKIILKNKNI